MAGIGPLELVIVLVIMLLVFGPKRLPGLGRQLGSGLREFKDSVTASHEKHADDDDEDDDDTPAAIDPPPAAEVPTASPASSDETVKSDAVTQPRA